jgi:hypothetical protein
MLRRLFLCLNGLEHFFVHGGAAPDGEGGKGWSHVIVQQQQSVTSLAVIQCQLGILWVQAA